MTTAAELGVTYSESGKLVTPKGPMRLNPVGVKYVQDFAGIFGLPIIEIGEGYLVTHLSMGGNGTTVNIEIPKMDKNGFISIPIDVGTNDYFLPPENH